MTNTQLGAVKWTGGFWGERFNVFSRHSLQGMWNTWKNPDVSHGFRNLKLQPVNVKALIGDLRFMMVICINGLKE